MRIIIAEFNLELFPLPAHELILKVSDVNPVDFVRNIEACSVIYTYGDIGRSYAAELGLLVPSMRTTPSLVLRTGDVLITNTARGWKRITFMRDCDWNQYPNAQVLSASNSSRQSGRGPQSR